MRPIELDDRMTVLRARRVQRRTVATAALVLLSLGVIVVSGCQPRCQYDCNLAVL